MTHTSTEQPEALLLVDQLRDICSAFKSPSYEKGVINGAIQELHRLHARIAKLEAQLSAIGAGGVEPLRKRAAPAHPAEGVPAQAAQPSDALIEAVDAWFAKNTGLGGCSNKDVAELAAIFATQPAAQAVVPQGFRDGVASLSANAGEPRNAIDRDALIDAIAQGLHGTWHCTRVWEAWHVGTMSQDDFEPVDESETPTEIADAVLALLATHPTQQGLDAARYRWLRDNDWRNDEKMEPVIRLHLNAIWDEKIDAALAAQAKQGERP